MSRKYKNPGDRIRLKKLRSEIYLKQGGLCYYCKKAMNPKAYYGRCESAPTLDHVIPVSLGGNNELENLVVSCKACNIDKGSLTVREYALIKVLRALPWQSRLQVLATNLLGRRVRKRFGRGRAASVRIRKFIEIRREKKVRNMELLVPNLKEAPGARVVYSGLYNNLDLSLLSEDLLAVELPGGFWVDLGWTPEHNPIGAFGILVYYSQEIVYETSCKTPKEAIRLVEELSQKYLTQVPETLGSES